MVNDRVGTHEQNMREDIRKIFNKYIPPGIVKGVEFLLPPETAISFIDDLVGYHVKINGCDLWKMIDGKTNQIVALLGAGTMLHDADKETIQSRGETVKDYIRNHLPEDAQLVSLIYAEDDIYELVRGLRNQ